MCLSLFACGTTNSENNNSTWSIKETVDEFGDITENSVSVISGTFNGTFSNTATADSELTVIVSFSKKSGLNHYIVGFDLKEYNNTNATFVSGDSKKFKMKKDDKITTMNLNGESPNGTLYLGTEDYTWSGDLVFNELLNGNDVRCIIEIGSSQYNFTIISDNLRALCDKNSIFAGAAELTVKEAVNILLEDNGQYIGGSQNCINKNFESFEIMKTEEIKESLNGFFLNISVSGYSPVGDYAFPFWSVEKYSPNNNQFTYLASYDVNSSNGKTALRAIKEGKFLAAYKNYRYKSPHETVHEASFENDLFTWTSENMTFTFQCRKVTDEIFLLCTKDENGNFYPSDLLFSCEGEEKNDLVKAVEYAQLHSIQEITN